MKSQNPYSEFQGPAGPGLLASRLLSAFISYHFSTYSLWLSDWAYILFTRHILVFPFPDYSKHALPPGHLHMLCSLDPHSYIIWSYASFKSAQMSPAQRGLFSTIPHNTIAAPSWHSFPLYLAEFVHVKLLQLCPSLCDLMDPMDHKALVCGILQVRTPEWVIPSSSKGFSPLKKPTSLTSPALSGRFFVFFFNLFILIGG